MGEAPLQYPPILTHRARRVLEQFFAEKNVGDDPIAEAILNAALKATQEHAPQRSATEYAHLLSYTLGWAIRSRYRMPRMLNPLVRTP